MVAFHAVVHYLGHWIESTENTSEGERGRSVVHIITQRTTLPTHLARAVANVV